MKTRFPALEGVREEKDQLAAEANGILERSGDTLADPDATRFHEIEQRLTELKDEERRLVDIQARAEHALATGAYEHGSGPDGDKARRGAPNVAPQSDSEESRARRTVDQMVRSERVPDYVGERAETLITDGTHSSRSLAARWAESTGQRDYETAFVKLLGDPQRGHLLWNEQERQAYQRVNEVATEMRAMNVGTNTAGGFMVPLTLDPAIMLTSAGSVNPMRRVSRVVQTTTDAWNGVTSAGVTAEWKSEGAEASDATPTLAQPSIPVHFGDAWVPYSFEYGMDAVDPLTELQRLLMDAADQLQATAFMNGTGSGQPTGLTQGLAASSKIAAATADTLVADDVIGLQNTLPSRFQPRAQWLANLTTINTIGSFETTNGSLRFPEVAGDRLLRKPLNEASELDAAGATANAGNDNVAGYGDFSAGFIIVDRIGTSVELVPNLFGTNQRPTGQRGLLLWFRTGSDVVVDNAIRLLTA